MQRITTVFLLSVMFILIPRDSCFSQNQSNVPDVDQFKNAQFNFEIIESDNNTFGYDIYVDGSKLIHQPSIPGMSGSEGFKTKKDAEIIANLVICKLQEGKLPPAVSLEELAEMKVIEQY